MNNNLSIKFSAKLSNKLNKLLKSKTNKKLNTEIRSIISRKVNKKINNKELKLDIDTYINEEYRLIQIKNKQQDIDWDINWKTNWELCWDIHWNKNWVTDQFINKHIIDITKSITEVMFIIMSYNITSVTINIMIDNIIKKIQF